MELILAATITWWFQCGTVPQCPDHEARTGMLTVEELQERLRSPKWCTTQCPSAETQREERRKREKTQP